MAYEYETPVGKPVASHGDRFTNPSWWNLFAFVPFILLAVFVIRQGVADREVAQREKTIVGTITVHDSANHNRYGYVFVIDGKSYTGWEIPLHAEPVIGQQVLVYYDPMDPNHNALNSFAELGANGLGPVPIVVVGIVAGTIFIFFRRRHFKREMSAQNR
ncbi:MAG TPA: DUF3592 domain-containing protein [Verrucomicrobiae bacterium]|jgi:hypothetical protein|nr:DUF3592 domain-containing protein [Verrucomicrobiae bacterium]